MGDIERAEEALVEARWSGVGVDDAEEALAHARRAVLAGEED